MSQLPVLRYKPQAHDVPSADVPIAAAVLPVADIVDPLLVEVFGISQPQWMLASDGSSQR